MISKRFLGGIVFCAALIGAVVVYADDISDGGFIRRDGQSTTTATIPFAEGISSDEISTFESTSGPAIHADAPGGDIIIALGPDLNDGFEQSSPDTIGWVINGFGKFLVSETRTYVLNTLAMFNMTGPGLLAIDAAEDVVLAVAGVDYESPLTFSTPLSRAVNTVSIANAAADGSTKGAATFTASDFNATTGNVSLDYTNGQAASGSTKGYLTSTDWTTFNNAVPGTVAVKNDAGTVTYYRPSADTDVARGTALAAAITAHVAGDSIVVGPGTYELSAKFTLLTGASLIGVGRPTLVITTLTDDPLIRLVNNNVVVDGINITTNMAGLGEFAASPITVSGLIIRNVNVACSATTNCSGLQFSETIGGGNTEHVIGISAYNSKFYGGSTTGYGVHMSLDDGSVVNLWGCDVYGATDGILNKNALGTSAGVTNIYGGKYASVLDAITSGGTGNVINVYGATARGDQADLYGDDGTLNVYWSEFRTDFAVGNGLNVASPNPILGNIELVAGQLKFLAFGGAVDVGLKRIAAAVLQVTDGASARADLEVADEAYNATNWNGSFECPTKNAVRDQVEVLQPLDATLTSLAAYNTNGLVTQTAANTFTGRSVAVTANSGLSVSNGDGVSGNPTLAGLNASTSVKGVAVFNSTNFSTTLGAVNTIQNINSTASPTFSNVTLGSVGSSRIHYDNSGGFDDWEIKADEGNFAITNTTEAATILSRAPAAGAYVKMTGPWKSLNSFVAQISDFTPYSTGYEMSLQSANTYTYLEILNNAGTNTGAFFGMESDIFAQYNWQGSGAGSGDYPIWFYAGWGGGLQFEIDRTEAGGSRFYSTLEVPAGASGSSTYAKVGGTVEVNTTAVGNVGTGEDTLISYTFPGSGLGSTGDYLEFEAAGTFTASANNKRVRCYFGGTGGAQLIDTGTLAETASTSWEVSGTVIRTGAATQKAKATWNSSSATLRSTVSVTAPTRTLSSTQAILCTGEGTSNNDILMEYLIVKAHPNQ